MQFLQAAGRPFWVFVFVSALTSPVQASEWMAWLATPISGNSEHTLSWGISWHGRLMVFAWAILFPCAVVVARYFKIVPGQIWPQRLDNPFWFITHRRLGIALAGVTAFAAALVVFTQGLGLFSNGGTHAQMGWMIVFLAQLQIVGGLLRGTHGGPVDPFTRMPKPVGEWPGDHFSMTPRRIVFEWSHKMVGYLLILLVVIEIFTGLFRADAPRWMWIGVGGWWLICASAVGILQRRVKCIDTYQAIWGFDQSLSGYAHKPIGIGITRFKIDEAAKAPWQSAPRTSPDPHSSTDLTN